MADNEPTLLGKLDVHLERQFQSLVDTGMECDQRSRKNCSAIDDAINEVDALVTNLRTKEDYDSGLQELRETLTDFKLFAKVYYRTIRGLVGERDHARLSQALSKIQQEIFVLRRLAEQRWSPNLRPALRLADCWSTEYLQYVRSAFEGFSATLAAQPAPRDEKEKVLIAAQMRSVADPTPTSNMSCEAASDGDGQILRGRCFTLVEDDHRIHLGVLAYKRNPTISLPLIHAKQPWHWLGLAHEVGHFAYHNFVLKRVSRSGGVSETALGQLIRQSIFAALSTKYVLAVGSQSLQNDVELRASLQQSMSRQVAGGRLPPHQEGACLGIAQSIPLWCTWTEELFADVLGAVTLGPAYIESLIDWVAPRLPTAPSLVVNDNDHPVACLRPVFQALVLLYCLDATPHAINEQLSEVLCAWFDFCEDRFRTGQMLKATPLQAKYSGGSIDGILERINYWRRNVRGAVSGIPLEVLFDQVEVVAKAVAAELEWAPVYTAGKHAFVISMGESLAQASTLERFGDALVQSITENPPIAQAEQRILLLACFWHQHRCAVPGDRHFSRNQLRRVLMAVGWVQAPPEVQHDAIPGETAPPTTEDAIYILCPLLKRWATGNNAAWINCGVALIREYYDGRDGSRREEHDAECPTALELADWLLGIPFAVSEDYSSRCCPTGQVPTGCTTPLGL